MTIIAPRYELALVDKSGRMAREWYQFFVLLAKSLGSSGTATADLQTSIEASSAAADSIGLVALKSANSLSSEVLYDPADPVIPQDTGLHGAYPNDQMVPYWLPLDLSLGVPNGFLATTTAALANNAAAAAGTLLNSPAAGNPTKWIKINDNGTTRSIPAW